MTTQRTIRLGVHASIAGGLHLSLERAHALGCTTVQIFSHNPRGWALRPVSDEEANLFRHTARELGIMPVYVHVSYLLNIASSDNALRQRSTAMLREEMRRADIIGAQYVVLHTGTAHDPDGMARAIQSLNEVFADGPYEAGLLLENTSGKRGDISSDIDDLARLYDSTNRQPAGVCLDTCHAFAAGYDFTQPGEAKRIAAECASLLGPKAVKLIHLNDSKAPSGSGTDRHAQLGLGLIGESGLGAFLRQPEFHGVPVILETPKDSDDDDRRNLSVARSLISA